MRNKRKKIWIDRFQTRLSLCIGFYFALYQIAIWALIVIERHIVVNLEMVLGPGGWVFNALLTGIVVGLGVLFMYDAVRLSHRIVGPLYRFRKTIQAIKAGEGIDLVTLRQGDFLQEMKDELNEMIKVLEARGALLAFWRAATQRSQCRGHLLRRLRRVDGHPIRRRSGDDVR